jgi:protoporphyrin/coproporphyrin ferrochelatase
MNYDAILLISFGGPEKPDDVMPFLENVLRGKNVPRARMLEVAEHYYHFGGRSPINDQNRALIAALREELDRNGPRIPIYWGNRNWHPMLADTLAEMKDAGVKRAFGFVTSAFSSYSGCRQYLEDLARIGSDVEIVKVPSYGLHPLFVEAMAESVKAELVHLPDAKLIFTAHSVPLSMASGCPYEAQLKESSRRVAERAGIKDWTLVYQSRSGPPSQRWLEPDVCDYLQQLGTGDVILAPIGFVSDHMEVVYDLDTQARELTEKLGIRMRRAGTVGTHPEFIQMIRELATGPEVNPCPVTCCPYQAGGRPNAV